MVRHSTEFSHILIYHLGPIILVAVLLYGGIFLMIRLAKRSNKHGKRKQQNGGRFNRHQHRLERAVKRKRS